MINRRGMSLMEIMIALALTVLVAGLTGGLMQWYVKNQTQSSHVFEELRIARTVLNMIGDDIRCMMRDEPFDVQPLVELIQASAGGGQGSGGASSSGGTSGGQAGGQGGGGGGSFMSDAAGDSSGGIVSSDSASSTTTATIGMLGTTSSIELDISRSPRLDESIVQPTDLMSGTLTDLPTDVKTVTYYVQGPIMNGVSDSLSSLSSDALIPDANRANPSGLIRRMIAKNALQKAYNEGETDRITRTGMLIAREVVGLSFEFYDGAEWLTDWDSSTQGLPIVVRVTIALQNPKIPSDQRLSPPLTLNTMSAQTLAQQGITVYSTIVPIPGAALATSNESSSSSTDDASSSLGL
jgi:hypothetical protein